MKNISLKNLLSESIIQEAKTETIQDYIDNLKTEIQKIFPKSYSKTLNCFIQRTITLLNNSIKETGHSLSAHPGLIVNAVIL